MRKNITLILLCVIVFKVSSVFATNGIVKVSDNPVVVIKQHIDAINQKDWVTFIELQGHTNRDDIKRFINNPINKENDVGLFNIESAKFVEIQSLPDTVVSGLTKLYQYQENYNDVKSYLVGIDYRVKNESKYHFNGVNYRLAVLGKENDQWKIVEMSSAPLNILIPKGYGFNNENEKKALHILEERMKGNIINSEGKIIGTNKASYDDIQLEKGLK